MSGPIPCPRPEITLQVRSRYGDFFPLRFAIDTGADLTAILIPRAESEGIPFARTNEGRATGLVGVTTQYRDVIHLAIAGREYDWPCNFLTPVGLSDASARRKLPVLGRAGFLDVFNFCTQDGFVVLADRGSLHNRWDRFWSFFGRPAIRNWTADEPL